MKHLSIILGLVVLLSAFSASADARSHFSLNFNNAVVARPAPVTYVVQSYPTYYQPVYVATPQPYIPAAPQVVYVQQETRPVVVRYARPAPVRQSSFGFSWNFFR